MTLHFATKSSTALPSRASVAVAEGAVIIQTWRQLVVVEDHTISRLCHYWGFSIESRNADGASTGHPCLSAKSHYQPFNVAECGM